MDAVGLGPQQADLGPREDLGQKELVLDLEGRELFVGELHGAGLPVHNLSASPRVRQCACAD